MQEAEIEELLNESEGTALDFKRDQYPLADNTQKGEFIKDVMAFANSWRRTDAYILIGVDEAKGGGPSTPTGITTHLKDSDLQQLVNSKMNRPISFSYEAVKFHAVELGVIKVPVQERPFFLTQDVGKVKKGVVYVRRNSSTAEALADEVLKMGAVPTVPSLDLQLADVADRQIIGNDVQMTSEVVNYDPAEIPEITFSVFDPGYIYSNKYYYSHKAAYIADSSLLQQFGFTIRNSGSFLAKNVRLELSTLANDDLNIVDGSDYPTRPSRRAFDVSTYLPLNRNLTVERYGSNLIMKVNFGGIQPGATAWSDEFYVGARRPLTVDLSGYLYGDNLPQPQSVSFKITIDTTTRNLDIEELEDEDDY
jgi:hypothetical protein